MFSQHILYTVECTIADSWLVWDLSPAYSCIHKKCIATWLLINGLNTNPQDPWHWNYLPTFAIKNQTSNIHGSYPNQYPFIVFCVFVDILYFPGGAQRSPCCRHLLGPFDMEHVIPAVHDCSSQFAPPQLKENHFGHDSFNNKMVR